ncbi:TonB-dependent receptor [bacterium]|nr:MAG: TonB-dependent receptor [bacterium]
MKKVIIVLLVSLFMITSFAFAAGAGNLAGKVTNEKNGDPIANANIYVEGTEFGMLTRNNGTFLLKNVPEGNYTVAVSYLGYELTKKPVEIKGGLTSTLNFTLTVKDIGIPGMTVFADRAEETTPVAYTDVSKEEIVMDLGSRDLPLVLKSTPSVYSTDQGGGAGDAGLYIRGFNQRNIAIMINGVPVNDMENGWVYWSNWDGVGDATSSIQVQRGLSAINLAVPSIGGTMNIITDPTQMTSGARFKQEYGSGNFRKMTLIGNTGLVDDKYALSFALVRKQGDGVADGTWTDAYAYYLATSYNLNDKNRLEFYAVGAPQQHGQRRYLQNIAAFSHKEARELSNLSESGTHNMQEYLDTFGEMGWNYNENFNTLNSAYHGQQWWDGDYHQRYDYSFLNESTNYYHKPQLNLNWFSQLTEKLNLYSTVYYSGGIGGGGGTFGSLKWDYSFPSRVIDWDATIANNVANDNGSKGILRNSVNKQWTIGAIVKAEYEVSPEINTLIGIDWRTAEIDHFREVRDLLGGDYYYWTGNEFDPDTTYYEKLLGDKIDYNSTNTVDWMGGFAQGEYKKGPITAFGSAGLSAVKYTFTDHFHKNDAGKEITTETKYIPGYQIKGGLSYLVMPDLGVFGNAGYVSKAPIFDEVIDDSDGKKADDPQNEKFMSGEAGFSWVGLDGLLNIKVGGYYTKWMDQVYREWVILDTATGNEEAVFISGLDSRHMGAEFEANFQAADFLNFQLNASKGFWKYTDDVSAVIKHTTGPNDTINVYVKDLKVGGQPQTQIALTASVYPFDGLTIKVAGRHYMDFWSNWNTLDRDDPNDRTQSWKVPNYSTVDLHLMYQIPTVVKGLRMTVFAHVFNLLDGVYIQDATDNSGYNCFGYYDPALYISIPWYPHTASAAEVFFGPRRRINLGVEIGL